jgi:hypothetical protein
MVTEGAGGGEDPSLILNARENGTKQRAGFSADEVAGMGFDD